MNIFDAVALLSISYIFPLPFWWFVIHSKFLALRKFGLGFHIMIMAIWVMIGIILFKYSFKILAYRLETRYTFFAGILLTCLVVFIDLKRQQDFSFTTIIGLPEVLPKKYKSKLITQGVFSYIRHPRYLEYILFALAMAFVTGSVICYLFFIYTLVAFNFLARLEEKELIQRFGKKYLAYMKRVPRFLPGLRA
ncbi:isoprenylcysteine carboxylmethyltransferase family protein [Candidatus Woesearchaeota archaeon]|nr:isoprenylcysteine carboxylmethyltransferase family protein [Candidatus Woesearchaeota archaeon]